MLWQKVSSCTIKHQGFKSCWQKSCSYQPRAQEHAKKIVEVYHWSTKSGTVSCRAHLIISCVMADSMLFFQLLVHIDLIQRCEFIFYVHMDLLVYPKILHACSRPHPKSSLFPAIDTASVVHQSIVQLICDDYGSPLADKKNSIHVVHCVMIYLASKYHIITQSVSYGADVVMPSHIQPRQ